MSMVEQTPSPKVRLPWSLRSKVEISPIQYVGQNHVGLPYLQGQIRNRSGRALRLRIVARVLNEQRQPIFAGMPGILDIFSLDPQQQRSFRISLHDVSASCQSDLQRLWLTRTAIELSVDS